MEQNYEQILQEFEPMIFHLINKYRIRDLEGDFYQEASIALWRASQEYDEKKMKFSSYAYFRIDKALLSLIRKRNLQSDRDAYYQQLLHSEAFDTAFELALDFVWMEQIKEVLTANQWIWFKKYVIEDKSVATVAAETGVSENAVKNWGRLARPKLQKLLSEERNGE